MKQKFLLIVLTFTLLLPLHTRAVSYRGFAEVGGGAGIRHNSEKSQDFFGTLCAYTTHGVQILDCLYAGAGIGTRLGIYEGINHASFDLYGAIRWDGFRLAGAHNRISPFIELKVGYQKVFNGWSPNISVTDNYNAYYDYGNGNIQLWDNPNYWEGEHGLIRNTANKHPSGLFIRPTIGFRIRFSPHVGMNIGIFCDIVNYINLKKVKGEARFTVYKGNGEPHEFHSMMELPAVKTYSMPFGAIIGIDF